MEIDFPYPLTHRLSYKNVIAGIYCIQNTETDRCYIGATKNIGARLENHHVSLEGKRHSNSRLQSDFNKFGLEAFAFRLLEECELDTLNERERFWSDELEACTENFGYTDYHRGYRKDPNVKDNGSKPASFIIRDDQLEAIKEMANSRSTSWSGLMRDILDEYLVRRRNGKEEEPGAGGGII